MAIDDWKAETKQRLAESLLYQHLNKKCDNDAAGIQVLQIVDEATNYAYQRTKTILRHMGEFTLHDGDHLFRVLALMKRLLSEEQLAALQVPELMLLILSAFFHDIGMAPDERDVLSWKKVWDSDPIFDGESDQAECKRFQRFYLARPEDLSKIEECLRQGDHSRADRLKNLVVSEYIRSTHAERAKQIIKNDWLGKIVYRDTDLTMEFARICFSHNEDPLSVMELDHAYLCGPGIYANLQLVAVLLRLSDLLDFDAKRTPSILFSHLHVRHPVSIAEWEKHRSVEAWNISPDLIQFHAKCSHPAIEVAVNAFCDIIDKELSSSNNIITSINASDSRFLGRNAIKVPLRVNRTKIETQKDIDGEPIYLYRETQFNLSKKQVIDLLMGTKLYGDPEVALRELIQNSIDACLLRRALEEAWGSPYVPSINVKYYSQDGQDILEVIDNGVGMDQNIIDSYYSKVGSSFYKSSEFYDLRSQSKANFTPTSRFGIGILSCFMVADTMVVDTRRVYGPHDSSSPLNLTIEGQDSIFWIRKGQRRMPGTTTKLFLRKSQNPWDRMEEDEFITSVENVVPNPPFALIIETSSHKKSRDSVSFFELRADSLANHTWDDHENIRKIPIEFDDPEKGFVGSAVVAILESHGMPSSRVTMTSRTVDIDGDSYELGREIILTKNEIHESGTSLSIDENGEIDQSNTHNVLTRSESRLSLHGIEVPTTLFPEWWKMQKNQVELAWPLPMLIVVDICGRGDLDLNSPRTQIIMSEKWHEFERQLSFEVCSKIARAVSKEYWDILVSTLSQNPTNQAFTQILEEVDRDWEGITNA